MIEKRFLDFSPLHKIYPTPKGPLTAVQSFDLKGNRGEFISLIGHSSCGKSTALTRTAGLNATSNGAIGVDVDKAYPQAT
jgi:nitrate/nitrite transport system ATP-binding protein